MMADIATWTHANLTTQGYRLSDSERRELWLGLRFSTGLCLALVIVALSFASPPMIFALSAVGAVGGLTPRHPFDLLWNNVVRKLTSGPPLPPTPSRRRHAFKIATIWLLLVGLLMMAGAATAALVLGTLLVAACAAVTAVNLCLPSEALAWWERRPMFREAITK